MFKVPDWGNDVPKSNVEANNVFTKKNKKKNKNNSNSNIKDNAIKNVNSNHKKKVPGGNRKPNKNFTGFPKLTKQDHINNRITKNNLKKTLEANNNEKEVITCQIKQTHINKNIDISSKVKNKILKRKQKNKTIQNNTNKNTKQSGDCIEQSRNNDAKSEKIQKSKKRKHKNSSNEENTMEIQNFNIDEPDRMLVNAKKKKLNDKIKNDDIEDELFSHKNSKDMTNGIIAKNKSNVKGNLSSINITNKIDENEQTESSKNEKIDKKKEVLAAMLKRNSNKSFINANGNKLRMKMLERLKAAQFRYLNEKLYTSSGTESQELFKSDPVAFQAYHEGFQQQVKKWPINPLDLIVNRIRKMPKTHLIADMGCGEAELAKQVPNKVRSFDLVVTAPGVEACNMAHTPLLSSSMDVVVFCLALMGTDLTQYLLEANRVLKIGGHLLIAEVESRFENAEKFSSDVQRLGFSLKKMDETHKMFFFMEFGKMRDAPTKKNKLPVLSLKPCLYKKR